MPDIKEKLVELLKCDPCPSTLLCDGNCNYAELERCFEERFADHLIANGVTFAEDKNVLTNADRIRTMSDEELVKMLTDGAGGFFCKDCRDMGDRCKMNCKEHCLEWLKQPAEEDQ